jgi:hypothetical protein
MNLTFLNPLFLFGLAAGILPILIHRLTQKKPLIREFSAVRLLAQSQRTIARPQRLKHLLLLALRVLAVGTAVLLIARPVLSRHGLMALGGEGAHIVILDNSLSMGFQEERGERFILAKKAAKEIIEKLKGQVMIIPLAPLPGSSNLAPEISWKSPEEAFRDLEAISLSFGRGDPAAALKLAFQKVGNFKGPKEILIISDLTRGDWGNFHLGQLGVVGTESGITFLRIGGENRDPNLAVKGVRLVGGEAVTGIASRLEVTVANLSDRSASTLVQLHRSGMKVDQKALDLKAGEDGKITLEFLPGRPGWINGEVKLSGDPMPYDDIFYFPLKIREKIRVLIVDGDPRTSPRASESYYLVHALRPEEMEGSPFVTTVITERELADFDLHPYGAVFLLNVARLPAQKLSSSLETGRPWFIFLGDRVVPGDYNNFPLLPWRLKELKSVIDNKPLRIVQLDREALRSLAESGEGSLKSASFHRYIQVEGSRKILLTLGNKDPLLLETILGKSKVFLFTSTADLDWNDLPLKAAYLPLVQGLLKEAVNLGKDSLPASRRYGEPVSEKNRPIQLSGPAGGPGVYQLLGPSSGETRQSVNLPLEESDLRKVSNAEVSKKFGSAKVGVVEYKEGYLSNLQVGRKELWPYLLGFLLVLLAVETGVANRI